MTIAAVLFAWAGSALAQGDEAAGVRAARERVARIEQAEGGGSVSLATALLELGVLLDSERANAEARTILERALAIREKALGKEHTATAAVLTRLGLLLEEQGHHAEARGALERSLAIREKLLGREHADTIASLSDLGFVLFEMGELDAARALFERALAAGEKGFGPRDPRVASYLARLGRVYSALGRAQAARDREERALAIRLQGLGLENLETAESQHDLAVLLQSAGEYVRACELFQRSLSTRAKLLGPGHPDTALTEIGFGSVLHAQGRLDEAEARLGSALAACEAQLGSQHPTTLRALDASSALLADRGRYREARPLLQRVYAGQQKIYPRDHPVVVATLGRLAVLLAKLGDAEAESLLEHAIAISEQTRTENPAQTALLVADLAELFEQQERYIEAEPLFERTLVITEKVSGSEHPNTARALVRLASCVRAQSKTARARPLYERALAILEKTVGADHPDTSAVLHSLGALARDDGDLASARAFLERALAARTRAFGGEHPNTQRTRQLLIFVLADSGERETAWTLATESTRANRAEWMRSLWSFSEGERSQSIAGRRASLGLMLEFVPAASDAAERATYEAVLEWKARAVRSLLEDPDRVFTVHGARTQLDELRGVQAEISTEQSRPVIEDNDAHERRLAKLRERRGALEQALHELTAAKSESIDVDTASLMRSLPVGTALVDFFVYQGYVPAVFNGGRVMTPGRITEPRLSAWVSKAGADHPVRVDLGPAHTVRQSERALLDSLQMQRGLAAATAVGRSAFDEASARLIELVWAPVKAVIGDARQVFIAPDRFLGTLPFEALLQDGKTYLIEQHSFVYLVDAASLSAIAQRASGASASTAGGLLAVGGIDYNLRGSPPPEDEEEVDESAITSVGFLEPWEKLRFSGREVALAAELFTSTHADGASVIQLRDGFATETALKREIPGRRYLHLATHGFFQQDDLASPRRSPVHSSGLACAGANLPPDGIGDDGLLTVEEITSLDLAKCDLVMLSACQPGLGAERGGDGVTTLQRAFQMQGAQTVIASLWSVDDATTIELVSSFYRRLWTDKHSKIDALRGAQLELLKKNRAAQQGAGLPYTWAAFVLSGDWR